MALKNNFNTKEIHFVQEHFARVKQGWHLTLSGCKHQSDFLREALKSLLKRIIIDE